MKKIFQRLPKAILVLMIIYTVIIVLVALQYLSQTKIFCSWCELDGWSNTLFDIISFPFSFIFYFLFHDRLFHLYSASNISFIKSMGHKYILDLILLDIPAILANYAILYLIGYSIKKSKKFNPPLGPMSNNSHQN